MGAVGSTSDISNGKHDINYKGGLVRYSVHYDSSTQQPYEIYIHVIEVPAEKRNQNIGTDLLNKVKNIADKNNLPITLMAVPIKNSQMTEEQLQQWYQKRGFSKEYGSEMNYIPKKNK